jgi:hypothetical protein
MGKTLALILSFVAFFGLNTFAQFEDSTLVYSIESRSSGRFLNGKNNNEIIFDQKKENNYHNVWYIIKQSDGTFLIKDYGNNKVLSVNNGSTEEDAKLMTELESGNDRQKWILIENYGFYIIKNKKSGLVVTVDHDYPDETDPNPDLNYALRYENIGYGVQKSYQNLLNQEFEIEPVKYNPQTTLAVPQLGWKPNDIKTVMLISTNVKNNHDYIVKDENGNEILTGTFTLFTDNIENTWNLYYYKTDISQLTQPGNYTITSGELSANFLIADDIYLNLPYVKGGTINYKDIFNGFWKYNRYYEQPVELLEATMHLDENGQERFTFTGNTYTLQPYGWFDAHSRDSKTARTAKILSDFAMAYFITSDSDNKEELYKNLEYGIKNLLFTQNEDGSWPAGKIRDGDDQTPYDRRYYHWIINVDVNTNARCVRALAQTYNIFKISNPELASQIMESAVKGWNFVINNEDLVDENIKYRAYTVDILTAAIEMANTTGDDQYYDKADQMINESMYKKGVFKKKDGSWPSETNNKYIELDNGCIPVICRYYNIARTNEMKEKVKELITDFTDYWISQEHGPQGVPKAIIDRTTSFGNLKDILNYAYNMLAPGVIFNDENAYQEAKSAFNLMTGFNAFATSYIVGLGNKTPTVNFFKRSFETGIGAELPGFTNTNQQKLIQDFTDYKYTEGVAPITGSLFYFLSSFNSYNLPVEPQENDLKFNEIKSNNNVSGASFIEIYNNSGKAINLSQTKLEIYDLNSNTPVSSIQLQGYLNPDDYFTITKNNNDFYNIYDYEADMTDANLEINSNTGGFVLKSNNTVLDYFNEVPQPSQTISAGDIYIRKGYDNDGTLLEEYWYNAGQNINGTPDKNNNVVWETNQNAEACDSYYWQVNGVIYTEPGIYTYILPNVYNIDSTITLNLTMTIDNTVVINQNTLTAVQNNAQYQWLDCNKNYQPIEGATSQSFEPEISGSYAVQITKDNCTVVSDCYTTYLGFDTPQKNNFNVYPNPSTGPLTISFGKTYNNININVINIEGKISKTYKLTNSSIVHIILNGKPGIYILEIIADKEKSIYKVIKM